MECKQPPSINSLRILNSTRSPEGSWHADYRDTAYIYIGGLPFELSEGDIITMFSQFGEPTFVKLVRDKETGKSRGFAFLKYEDQRSTDLAVDNMGGAVIMGRTLRVDHTRYKKRDDEEDEGENVLTDAKRIGEGEGDRESRKRRGGDSDSQSEDEEERPMLPEERELAILIRDHDEDDPMKSFLIQEKKEEVAAALAKLKQGKRSEKSERSRKHRHHHHHHRSRRREKDEDERDEKRSSRREREHRRRSDSGDEKDDSHKKRDEKPYRSTSSRHDREGSEEYSSRRRDRRDDDYDRPPR